MISAYFDHFTKRYQDSDYLTIRRVRTLAAFLTAFIFIILVMILVGGFQDVDTAFAESAYYSAATVILSSVALLILLYKGYYPLASYLGLIIAIATLTLGSLVRSINDPTITYITSLPFWVLTIIYAMQFTSMRAVTVTTIYFSSLSIFLRLFFITPERVSEVSWYPVNLSFLYGTFALVITGALGIMVVRTYEKTLAFIREEKSMLDQKDQVNRHLLQAVQKTFNEINSTVAILNKAIGEFLSNSRTQVEVTTGLSERSGMLSGNALTIDESAGLQDVEIIELTRRFSELWALLDSVERKSGEFSLHFGAFNKDIEKTTSSIGIMEKHMDSIIQGQKEMTTILTMVEELFERIDLLSLNASIEAARAGAAGKGFEVVADEIRKISSSSRERLSDIAGIISKNTKTVASGAGESKMILETTQAMVKKVEELHSESLQIMKDITTQRGLKGTLQKKAESVHTHAGRIREIADNQRNVVKETNEMISKNDAAANENKMTASFLAQKSKELTRLSEELQALVNSRAAIQGDSE